MNGTRFDELKSFPKIFIDFLNNYEKIKSRYLYKSSNPSISDTGSINDIINPSTLKDGINQEKEFYNYTIVKPGFFGGSLTDIYKIISLINISAKNQCIPLIIIDDDEFVSKSTYSTYIYDDKLIPKEISLIRIGNPEEDNLRFYNIKTVGSLIINKNDTQFSQNEIKFVFDTGANELYRGLFKAEEPLTDAYISFLKLLFSNSEAFFIKMSDIRKHISTKKIKEKIIVQTNEINKNINDAVNIMRSLGYDIKPKIFDTHLYEIVNYYKRKLSLKDLKVLTERNHNNHQEFSPTVMMKNIFIESIIATKSVVLSPSEISYFSILKENFELFKISIPEIIPRFSFSLIDKEMMKELHSRHLDHKLFEFVFPNGDFQERIISPVYFIYLFGINVFSDLCTISMNSLPDQHYTVNI